MNSLIKIQRHELAAVSNRRLEPSAWNLIRPQTNIPKIEKKRRKRVEGKTKEKTLGCCVFQNDLFRNTLFPELKSVAFHDPTSGPSAHFFALTSRRTNIENKMTLSL